MKKKGILLFLIALLIVSFGMSFAYWQFTITQESENLVGTSCLEVTYTDQNPISLENAVPILDEEGKKLIPYEFTIMNVCSTNITYEINLEVLEKSSLKDFDYLKFMLNEKEPEILTNKETVAATIENGLIAFPLKSGYLGGNETVNYTLRLWLDENTPTDTKYMNKIFASKISVVSLNYPIELDKTPPIASFTTTKVEGGYLVDAISSTDDNSGIAKYYYSKDGENWITSTEDNYVFKDDEVLTSGKATDVIESISSSKVYDIYVKVEDKFENVSETVSKNVKTRELEYDDTLDKNLRYVGSNLNNYVLFNNEKWRIIGVMNHVLDKAGNQNTYLKMERTNAYSGRWHDSESTNWSTSNILSNMNAYYNGLTTENKNMIAEVLWNLGTLSSIPSSALAAYEAERGTGATWNGKMGLFSPSDYRYASWTHMAPEKRNQWTMFTVPSITKAWCVNVTWFESSWTHYPERMYAYSTVYLNPEVEIVSGNGSSSSPFQLKI